MSSSRGFFLGLVLLNVNQGIGFEAHTTASTQSCNTACAGAGVGTSFYAVSDGGFGLAVCIKGVAVACADSPVSVLYSAPGPAGNATIVSSPYALVTNKSEASAVLLLSCGSTLNITDTFEPATSASAAFSRRDGNGTVTSSFVAFSRTSVVTSASGVPGSGFATRLSLPLTPSQPAAAYSWFMPGVYYNDGGAASGAAWIPPGAIGGNRAGGGAAVAREDRMGSPLVLLQDQSGGGVVGLLRPAHVVPPPNTVLAETLTGAPLVDGRLAFASLGPEPCGGAVAEAHEGSGPREPQCTALTALLPGCEFERTYQSGAPAAGLLRLHPLTLGFTSTLELVLVATTALAAGVGASAVGGAVRGAHPSTPPLLPDSNCTTKWPNPQNCSNPDELSDARLRNTSTSDARFLDLVDWAMRGAAAYYSPLLRADINVTDAYEAQVRSTMGRWEWAFRCVQRCDNCLME